MSAPLAYPRATLNAAALRDNLAVVRRYAPTSRVIAVIKANAYGHGMVPAARALTTADALAVARPVEAVALRDAGITQRILLLEGVTSVDELQQAATSSFDLVVHSQAQIDMLREFAGGHRFAVWFKVNTGMNRLGFAAHEVADAYRAVQACESVGELRLMTHLASGEESDGAQTSEQLEKFAARTAGLAGERSIANSAGLIASPASRADWVRPGIMLYGISPFPTVEAAQLGLVPVMSLSTALIAVRGVRAGEGVGYNATWAASSDTQIGIAAIGYGDGYPRGASNGAPVLFRGQATRVVGRVSMDMIAIDLSAFDAPKLGEEVVLWGDGLPVERVAQHVGTIGYELVCHVNQRVRAEWKGLAVSG